MQHPEDGYAARIDGVDAVNNQIGKSRDHEFPCAGRPAQPAALGKSVKLLDRSSIRRPTRVAAAGFCRLIHATMPRKSSWAGLVHVIVMIAV